MNVIVKNHTEFTLLTFYRTLHKCVTYVFVKGLTVEHCSLKFLDLVSIIFMLSNKTL